MHSVLSRTDSHMSSSQDLEEAYQDAEQFYFTNRIRKRKSNNKVVFSNISIPIILPRHLVQDIDTFEDWQRVEKLYELLNKNIYDKWNSLKQTLEKRKQLQFNEREILFISMGQNMDFEQYGKGEAYLRPVVVVKKFNKHLFLGIPLSSKIKDSFFFHIIHFKERENSALLLQSKTFDSKRIKYGLAKLSENEFNKLVEKLCEVVTPTPNRKGSA